MQPIVGRSLRADELVPMQIVMLTKEGHHAMSFNVASVTSEAVMLWAPRYGLGLQLRRLEDGGVRDADDCPMELLEYLGPDTVDVYLHRQELSDLHDMLAGLLTLAGMYKATERLVPPIEHAFRYVAALERRADGDRQLTNKLVAEAAARPRKED